MEFLSEQLVILIISNCIALIILWAAIKKPKISRLLFALLFGWASWLNYTTAHQNPSEYLNYASLTPFPFYENFIMGWFKTNVTLLVSAIAIGQGLIAIGLLLKGWIVRIACVGAIIFFIAILPLGIGSGFPFPLITALAMYFILKKDDLNYLWLFNNS